LIAALNAERDGVPWPPTSHRLRAETPRRTPAVHGLLAGPTDDPTPRVLRIGRRAAPLLVGLLVLGVVGLVGSMLRVVPAPTPTDAALVAAPTAAATSTSSAVPSTTAARTAAGTPTSSAVPSTTAAPTSAATSAPTRATSKATTATRASKASSTSSRDSASPTSRPGPGAGGSPSERLGVGGVATPANAVVTTGDSTEPLKIRDSGSEGSPRVYDGQGRTVGTIDIRADWVVVQNFKVQATGQYGIDSRGTHVTIQNNDIKGVHASGDGDLNAITFFGDYTSIRNNTAIDFVSGGSGDSHTDAIQTWNQHPGESSSYVVIQGNYFSGPLEDDHSSYIHQCVMSEGAESTDGGGGGTGPSRDWLVAGNYCVGDMKFDDIDSVTVTGNEFAGIDKRVVVVTPLSSGFEFYSDNKITGRYGQIGVELRQGQGPGPGQPAPGQPGR
jgi:hypothetical protein